MEQLHQPDKLMFHRNFAEIWQKWKKSFTIYKMVTGKTADSREVECFIFIYLASHDILDIVNTLTFNKDCDKKKLYFSGYNNLL